MGKKLKKRKRDLAKFYIQKNYFIFKEKYMQYLRTRTNCAKRKNKTVYKDKAAKKLLLMKQNMKNSPVSTLFNYLLKEFRLCSNYMK
jgi:hypothetical protein